MKLSRCDHPGCIGVSVGCMERAAGPLYCAGHEAWAREVHAASMDVWDEFMRSPEYEASLAEDERLWQESSTSSSARPARLKLLVSEKWRESGLEQT